MSAAEHGDGVTVDFFFYGTLRDVDVRTLVLGRPQETGLIAPATLPGHLVAPVRDADYPIILPAPGAQAAGILVQDVELEAAARASFFEGEGYDYLAAEVAVLLGDGRTHNAWVYMSSGNLSAVVADWRIKDWERRYKAGFLAKARRAMTAVPTDDLERHKTAWLQRVGQ